MILAKKRRRLLVYAPDVQLISGFKGSFPEFVENRPDMWLRYRQYFFILKSNNMWTVSRHSDLACNG